MSSSAHVAVQNRYAPCPIASPKAKYSHSASIVTNPTASAKIAVDPHSTIPTTNGIKTTAVATRFHVIEMESPKKSRPSSHHIEQSKSRTVGQTFLSVLFMQLTPWLVHFSPAISTHSRRPRSSTAGKSSGSRKRSWINFLAASANLPMYCSREAYRSTIEGRGSPDFSRSAALRAKGRKEPRKLSLRRGAPMLGSRKFDTRYAARGPCRSGRRTPPKSFPSPSVCGTKTANAFPTLGGSFEIIPDFHCGPKSRWYARFTS